MALFIGNILAASFGLVTGLLNLSGNQLVALKCYAFVSAVKTVALVLFLPIFGTMAAAIVSMGSLVLVSFIQFLAVRKELHINSFFLNR